MAGILYVVATPIGNMEDITLRALNVLKSVDLIAAEDTRRTGKLLAHYGISRPLTSYFEHNEKEKAKKLIDGIKAGLSAAIVSDAGTPGISDPGYRLIKAAVESSVRVVSIPGPSAIISAVSVAGLPVNEFTFKGFVPSKAGERKAFFTALKAGAGEHTYVMYESARRLKETLLCVIETLGNVDAVVAREMTKLHEEIMRGKADVIMEAVKDRELKGEVTLIIRAGGGVVKKSAADLRPEIEAALRQGQRLKEVVTELCARFDVSRGELYETALKVKRDLNL